MFLILPFAFKLPVGCRRAAAIGLRAAFVLAICTEACWAQAPATAGALQSAEMLQAAGKLPEAIAAYQQVLKRNPRNEAAELGLADAYRRVHNIEEARAVLQRARRHHPQSAAVLAAMGDLEMEVQSYSAAIAALRGAVTLAPGDLRVRNLLAGAYLSKGEKELALGQLNKALERDPENGPAHFLRAEVYADQNENQKALRDAESVFAAQPGNSRGRTLLAKILVHLKQCERAANLLRPAANPPQLDTEALFLLGNAYECAGQTELAKKARDEFAAASQADRMRAEDEVQSKHYVEQANELAVRGDFGEALGLLQRSLERNPQNGFAYSQRAKIYFSMHQPEQAREAITKALAIQPYQPDFLYVLGVIEENADNFDAALSAFEKITQINPKESDAYFEIGKICAKRGENAKALAAFRTAVELAPDDPEYRKALADATKHR
jgi:tetratricopeptide (TPR) repeat protein